MARNRPTVVAPPALTRLSKSTLADMVWELAAVAPACESCDDFAEVWRVVREAALQVKAPKREVSLIESARDRVVNGVRPPKAVP